jgi:two-component system, sensor histidine kinase and response regulator
VLLWADRGEIEIILNNSVSNAVKHNRDGGKVKVRVCAEQEQVILEVADTGIGMSEQEVARLFQEFVRIKSVKTRNITGSGLGLSIVKKLALLNGGDVIVHSQPDVGTTFCVSLKRQQGQKSLQ